VAAARTAGSACEVAVAVRGSEPGTANTTASVLIGTTCEAPGASVTRSVASCATSAAGPPRARVKVSVAVPVLVTVSAKALPGAPGRGLGATGPPAAETVRAPAAEPLTASSAVAVATTWNGREPGLVPAAGVRVKMTSRKLLAPGGTAIVGVSKTAAT